MNELWLQHKIVAAFDRLMKARCYAIDVEQGVWDFAVEIDELRELGLKDADLLWLVGLGMLKHACETTQFGADRRSFDHADGLSFNDRTCFVLAQDGVDQGDRIQTQGDSFPHSISGDPRRTPLNGHGRLLRGGKGSSFSSESLASVSFKNRWKEGLTY